ncbi:unnamed protein product [Symbiodinium sp. CCMP2592]|nr:unnamed protein product [Symbiodinium sp. CCMP2592]
MAEIVDIEDSPPPRAAGPRQPSVDELKKEIRTYLLGKDLSSISLKALRVELETRLDLPTGGLNERKGEIRSIAEDLVTEAQNAAPLLPPVVQVQEPTPKRRKVLATPEAAAVPAAEPLSPVKSKAPKRKNAPSAYMLWSKDQRSTVVEELEKSLQRKPSFVEISKAIPERWKAADEAEKAVYEQKAKIAKEQLALEPAQEAAAKPKKAEAKKPAAKKGKGKGKGKQSAEDSAMTRAEFFQNCPVLRCAFDLPGNSPEESRPLAAPMDLVARTFKSGGAGWFSSVKFDLPVGSQQVTVQAQVVMNVSGSKYWEDGEGLEAALKALEGKAQQAVAKHDDPTSAVEEAPCTPKRRAPRSLMQLEAVQAPVAEGNNKVEEAAADSAEGSADPVQEACAEPATNVKVPIEEAEAAVPDAGMQDAPEVNAEAEAAPAMADEDMPDAPEVTADAEAEEAVAAVPDEGMPDVPELTAEAEEAVAAVPDEDMPHAAEVHAEAEAAAAVPDEGVPDAPESNAEAEAGAAVADEGVPDAPESHAEETTT